MPCSFLMVLTFAYLIAERESATTEMPAIPVAKYLFTFSVVESHLEALVAVLVVHIVDNVQECLHTRRPAMSIISSYLSHYIVVSRGTRRSDRTELRSRPELPGHLINTAVYSVEQALCQVCSCAEELHFLADISWKIRSMRWRNRRRE